MTEKIHSTPAEAITETHRETITVACRSFIIERPSRLDCMFEHPAVLQAYAEDEYIPYWSELWPISRKLAEHLLTLPEEELPANRTALEIGCGLGLAGLAALARGFHVTFTDVDETATRFAATNAVLNGFTHFATQGLDLRAPPKYWNVSWVIAADVLYEPRLIEPMVAFLKDFLRPGRVAMIADQDRCSAKPFRSAVERAGMKLKTADLTQTVGEDIIAGTLYRITCDRNKF